MCVRERWNLMENGPVNDILASMGALAELLGVFKAGLEGQGFDRDEIMCLCLEYLRCTLNK